LLRAQFEHAIALLTGRPPAEITIPVGTLPIAVSDVPVAVPAVLLQRRPDIAQAERTVQQENALIGVATAALYPDISLSGAIGAAGTGPLFAASNELWSLASRIALNEYQAGTVTYTTVVIAQATLLGNEQAALQIAESRLTTNVSPIRALGGGWTDQALVHPDQNGNPVAAAASARAAD
jgi:outer membrane protein TolC